MKTNTKELINIEGTVAYAIATNMDYVNNLCISKKSLEEVKAGMIELLETKSKKCKSRDNIIENIKRQSNKYKVFQYVCDCMLAGAGEQVIKVS